MHLPSPTISILVITYNHEPYIEEALSSILAQKVDTKLENSVSANDLFKKRTRALNP